MVDGRPFVINNKIPVHAVPGCMHVASLSLREVGHDIGISKNLLGLTAGDLHLPTEARLARSNLVERSGSGGSWDNDVARVRGMGWIAQTLGVYGTSIPGQAHLKLEWVFLYGDRVICNQNPFVPRGCILWVCSQRHRFRTIVPR